MRQLIIARKDLNMSPGKLAAQVAHASFSFISWAIRDGAGWWDYDDYRVEIPIPRAIYEDWFCGKFTKTVCEARNKSQLLKAKTLAEELGLREGVDFFLIYDACLTELEPEEDGRTLTCIGFRPLEDDIAWKISKKFQLYR